MALLLADCAPLMAHRYGRQIKVPPQAAAWIIMALGFPSCAQATISDAHLVHYANPNSISTILAWILGTGLILLLFAIHHRNGHLLQQIGLLRKPSSIQENTHGANQANCTILNAIHGSQQTEAAFQRQLEFNELITHFLKEFAKDNPETLTELVNDCLRRIVLYYGVESAVIISLSRNASRWSCLYSWRKPDTTDFHQPYQNIPLGTLPWPETRVLNGDVILIPALNELPPDASDYRAHLEQLGVKSIIILPFLGQTAAVAGCMALISIQREVSWDPVDVQRLHLASDVLSSVLVRRQAEEFARKEKSRIHWLLQLHEQADAMTDEALFENTLEAAVSFTDSEYGFLHGLHEDQVSLVSTRWSQTAHSQPPDTHPIHKIITREWKEAVQQKQPTIFPPTAKHTVGESPDNHIPAIHLAILPLVEGDMVRFILGVCNKHEPYDDHDIRQLQVVANELQKLVAHRRDEEALHNSREQYALAVDGVNDGVWDWNLQTNELYLSPRWKKMLDYDETDLPNRYESWESLIHPDDRPRVLATIQMYLSKPVDVYEAEMRLRCKNGGYRWILARGKALRDSGGIPYRIAGSHTDITERKQSEEEVRAERDYAQRILDTVETIIVSINRKGRITLVNRKGCEILGYPEEMLIGSRWFELCLPQPKGMEHDYPAYLKIMEGTQEGSKYLESEVLLRNGEHRLIAWRNTYLYGDANRLMGILQGGEDITERKRAEEALRASELKYRIVAENTFDWEFWRAPDKTYIYVSPSCERITGYPVTAFIDEPDLMERLIYPGDKRIWHSHQHEENSTPEVTHIELRIVCADGSLRWIAHECRSVYDESGNHLGIRGSNRDITATRTAQERERLQREQALQANKLISLGTLVSGVAHEINNPNHIISFSASTIGRVWTDVQAYLEENPSQEEYRFGGLDWQRVRESIPELLSSLRKASDRIKDIVEDLRAYARPDLERIVEEVDMGVVVHAAATWLTHLIKKSTHRFSVVCEPDVPCIQGNRRHLEQVLVNLVLNACQSLPDPDRAIRIHVSHEATIDQVVVEVVDEGVGMSKEVLDHVMDPFFTTKRDIGSTGLGLSIVFGIINEHGGTLTFESKVGEGTTARVVLPVSREEI